MAKDYGDYTIKGKTFREHLETEDGCQLLMWLTKQKIEGNEKLKSWSLGRNKWIKEQIELRSGLKTAPESPTKQTKNELGMEILGRLEAIENKLIKLESIITDKPLEEVVWDE